ncbi:hypothetical protein [Trichocoleus sp. FACHB-262]|uniref:hypothetical protein n=1 Tax=Trichocoleus sp. FACHB-262 TaxID=2692869 RepID=UPI001684DBC9|nr:hypothetical protein [Trichocoleus sp. FACHB-262]MBD2121249.1 hypothetical protein [Trichocoleus sp. FACHB-262]
MSVIVAISPKLQSQLSEMRMHLASSSNLKTKLLQYFYRADLEKRGDYLASDRTAKSSFLSEKLIGEQSNEITSPRINVLSDQFIISSDFSQEGANGGIAREQAFQLPRTGTFSC